METLRLFPVLPVLLRELQDDVKICKLISKNQNFKRNLDHVGFHVYVLYKLLLENCIIKKTFLCIRYFKIKIN